jgi:3-oxoacyl-[acyl-carrier-protein] synthase II
MAEHRVVITGLGAVTPLGLDVESTWEGLRAGRSGVGPITLFDAARFDTRIAAEVRGFDPTRWMERKEARRMDRFCQIGVAAAVQAVEAARLPVHETTRDQIGVLIGSGIGGILTLEEQTRLLMERGPDRISPFLIPMMICDMVSGMTSILLGLGGPNNCVVTACATGSNAIGDAAAIVRRGDAVAMLAGGSEAAVTPLGIGGFCAMKALSTRNDEPERASRPFDAERDGFVMGEGAAVFVLEQREFALSRGARVLAEVVGYGMSADAYHMTQPAPNGSGAVRSMRQALRDAGLRPEEVDYVNAHGTSTGPNDRNETAALKTVFGDRAYQLPVSSTKSMTGHLLGAAGAVEAMCCVLAIRDGVIPPTINYEHPDPECDLDYVPNQAREGRVRVTMSNSFGFGGHNATLIIKADEQNG